MVTGGVASWAGAPPDSGGSGALLRLRPVTATSGSSAATPLVGAVGWGTKSSDSDGWVRASRRCALPNADGDSDDTVSASTKSLPLMRYSVHSVVALTVAVRGRCASSPISPK